MRDLSNIMDADGAIPFSALMNKNKQDNKQKKTKKKSRSPSRKRKQKRNNKRTKKKAMTWQRFEKSLKKPKPVPAGVIIRKNNDLYKSDGRNLVLLDLNRRS